MAFIGKTWAQLSSGSGGKCEDVNLVEQVEVLERSELSSGSLCITD
jgi:hypothetical protein